MKRYHYYAKPNATLPKAAGYCGVLLTINTIYTLISMPNYIRYWDYWATLVAGIFLGVVCFLGMQRRTETVLLPTGLLVVVGSFDPNLTNCMEFALFMLLLLMLLLRLPTFVAGLFRFAGTILTLIGWLAVLLPVYQRIHDLSQQGKATADFVVPYLLRSLGGDVLFLFAMLLLIFAMQPYKLPGWMDEEDTYDRIWE